MVAELKAFSGDYSQFRGIPDQSRPVDPMEATIAELKGLAARNYGYDRADWPHEWAVRRFLASAVVRSFPQETVRLRALDILLAGP